jgi:hypothetical protein
MWDTVEHLAHPEAYVERVYDLLPPGGWLFLSTGDVGSWLARWRGQHWRLIHPPTHLQYFSRSTMARFRERHGFEVRAVHSLSICRTVSEIIGRLNSLGRGISRHAAGLLAGRLPGWLGNAGLWLDLGDIMFVAAQRRG